MEYTIQNDALTACIRSEGAELRALDDRGGRHYMWSGDPAVWSGTSPLLFPVVGKLAGDSFRHGGNTYAMPKHGFAKDSDFALDSHSGDSLSLTLRDSPETLACWPFPFLLTVQFALEGLSLRISHRVRNTGEESCYFSLGAHPAIACRVGDCLEFERPETADAWQFGSDMLIREEKTPFLQNSNCWEIMPDSFERDAYILEGLLSRWVKVRSGLHKHAVQVDFGGAPYLGIWAKPRAEYVCIEPWFGLDDDHFQSGELSEKKGIVSLPPGEEFDFTYRIQIEG